MDTHTTNTTTEDYGRCIRILSDGKHASSRLTLQFIGHLEKRSLLSSHRIFSTPLLAMHSSASWIMLLQAATVALAYPFIHGCNDMAVEARAELATCAAPPNTLSSECDSKCAESTPCWLNVTASTTNCSYLCYNGAYVDTSATSFMFLVPFGEWTRAHLTTSISAAALSPIGDTESYSYANNDILESITTMKLRNTTDYVYVHTRRVS